MNLKEEKLKFQELGKAIEYLNQPEKDNLQIIYFQLDKILINKYGLFWSDAESPSMSYDKSFGDDKICSCGHPYYRHFDPYDDNKHIGCKYCDCFDWKPLEEDRVPNVMEFSKLMVNDTFKILGNKRGDTYLKIEAIKYPGGSMFNAVEVKDNPHRELTMFPDHFMVEKIISKEK